MKILFTTLTSALLFLTPSICLGKELIIFGADWCPACVKLKNFVNSNPKELEGFDIQIIDIDKNPEVKKGLKIRLLPTSVIFDNDKLQSKLEGYTQSNFTNWIIKNK